MPLMTGEQYLDSIKKLNMNIYLFGEKINNPVGHPMLQPALNSVKMTYDLAQMDEFRDLLVTTSSLTGETINRFTALHTSPLDLVAKVKMQRLLGQKTGSCFQRCVGMDGINSTYATAYDIDQKYGTNYQERFIEFLKRVQREDLVVDGAMTDPKGDRSKSPSQQLDPDLYLHVVDRNDEGIFVTGAKAHQTGITSSHEILVMPTMSLSEADKDYAVSFSTSIETPGITIIVGRQSSDTRKLEGSTIDVGNAKFGGMEGLVVFENVFVPYDQVYMDGEYEFANILVERFAGYHRSSYACKTGVGDVLIGAATLAAESNGVAKASHVKDKLIEMIHLNETIWSGALACCYEGIQMPAGNYIIDGLLANITKQNVTRFPYEIARLAEDIAGGLMVTAPSEKDLRTPEIAPYIEKYMAGNPLYSTEDRLRIVRLIENLTLGTAAVAYRTESMHGAGSPQAQRIMIGRLTDFSKKKKYASDLAGLSDKSK